MPITRTQDKQDTTKENKGYTKEQDISGWSLVDAIEARQEADLLPEPLDRVWPFIVKEVLTKSDSGEPGNKSMAFDKLAYIRKTLEKSELTEEEKTKINGAWNSDNDALLVQVVCEIAIAHDNEPD